MYNRMGGTHNSHSPHRCTTTLKPPPHDPHTEKQPPHGRLTQPHADVARSQLRRDTRHAETQPLTRRTPAHGQTTPPTTLEGMHNRTGTLGTQRNNRTRTQHSHGWTNNPHTDAQPHTNT